MMRIAVLLVMMLGMVACGERQYGLAPVEELTWHPRSTHQGSHIVKRGETLYAIAFRYDKDFRQLAAYNHLRSPYALRVGQVIRIKGAARNYSSYIAKPRYQPVRNPIRNTHQRRPVLSRTPVQSKQSFGSGRWYWPAKGRVVATFIPQQGKKGIDIAGKKGDKIYASANGIVAYAGSGLAGYGNLIIIKHDGQFLTAYGNNALNRVKEGQRVKAGQIIADMGVIDRKFWGVHFEIRKAGQPVNPANYLRQGRF